MTLSDYIFESFNVILKEYKTTYINKGHQYSHSNEVEKLLFHLLKTLYVCDMPEQSLVRITGIPSDDYIRNHIHELIYNN